MYVVWVTVFAELFNRTGQHWALVPQPPSTPKPSHIWRCFSTSAKIRFRCVSTSDRVGERIETYRHKKSDCAGRGSVDGPIKQGEDAFDVVIKKKLAYMADLFNDCGLGESRQRLHVVLSW